MSYRGHERQIKNGLEKGVGIIYALLTAFAASLLVFLNPGTYLSTFENKTIDARHRFHASPSSHTKDILILDISEESIKRLEPVYGRWPWPRSVHGEVIKYLKEDGAKAIGFDIIFSEHAIRQEVDPKLIYELRTFARNSDIPEIRSELMRRLDALNPEASDASFVDSVKQAGNVFQSSVFYVDENDLRQKYGTGADENSAEYIRSVLSRSALPAPNYKYSNLYFNATVPFPELAVVSSGIGYINIHPDKDGVTRRFYPLLFFRDREKAYPSLPLIIASYVKDVPLDSIRIDKGKMFVGNSILPLSPDGSALISYQGGRIAKDSSGKETHEPFYEYIHYDYVLASKDLIEAGKEPPLQKGMFKDKIVLISASAVGLKDLRSTPFSPVTPGVEIHANIIDNILSNRFLHTINNSYERLYIFFLAAIIAIISHLSGPYKGFFAVAATAGSFTGFHWIIFGKGIVLPIVDPVVAITMTYLGMLLLNYILEQKEKTYIKTAFGYYIDPAVLENILKSPEKLKLGGEKRYMTVLFSDLEGFTALSEQLPPDEISAILNEYLSCMVQCIMQTKGTLDKFIGDSVMAFWNAPSEQKDHAALACETALLMMKELNRLRKKWAEEQKPLLNARIGINTGEMVVGNMGSKEIFDYTVIGSEVNTASRLESVNKDFGTRIAVSHATRMEAEKSYPERFIFRRLAGVVLRGRNKPIEVYELISEQEGKEIIL